MFDHLHYFELQHQCTVVALPFPLARVVEDWSQLRSKMARQAPAQFSRDEWAYLIAFLSADSLMHVYESNFGKLTRVPAARVGSMARPRGLIAIWLPNNVSLLGPLALILLSLTGNPIRLKGGTHSEDLTFRFLHFARKNLSVGPLLSYLETQVQHDTFERGDPRHQEMAASARMRVVFGAPSTAEVIHGLPHPLESVGLSFTDRQSEAWIESSAMDTNCLKVLLKVFAVYGQMGCTSPRRVVLLDASLADVIALRDRLLDMWPAVVRQTPPMHLVSNNVMARQLAAALGWDARLAAGNGAVLAAGAVRTPPFSGLMALMIVSASVTETLETLPPNIQTIGYKFNRPTHRRWLGVLGQTQIKRLVPIGLMHHFGPTWDGHDFWAQAFERIEIA